MELRQALRTTGAVRTFTDRLVTDDELYDILETARFAPNGGNRQGWRVVVVRDPEQRRLLRSCYLDHWYEYLAQGAAGLVPWAVVTDRSAEAAALEHAPAIAEAAAAGPGGFAEHLDEAPVLLLVLADLRCLATVDRDMDRYTMVGGGSIYPFVWSMLLAARIHGLGGVLTTMVVQEEARLREAFGFDDEVIVAGLVALGEPTATVTRLRRAPVESFCTIDRADGTPFSLGDGPQPATESAS
jgi:nitroreductase